MIEFSDFLKVDIRVGTIVEASINKEAKKPAYVLKIDFGPLGIKTTSAQITQLYTLDDLINKKILAVVNFPVKQIGHTFSEVLVLGAYTKEGVSLASIDNAENGDKIG